MLTNVNDTLPFGLAYRRVLMVGLLADDEASHVGGYTNGGAKVVTVWEAVQTNYDAVASCTRQCIAGASTDSFDTVGIAGVVTGVSSLTSADLVVAVVGASDSTAAKNHDVDDLDLSRRSTRVGQSPRAARRG